MAAGLHSKRETNDVSSQAGSNGRAGQVPTGAPGRFQRAPHDSLAEWSKAVDSSSTIFGCVGSNPSAVIPCIAMATRWKFKGIDGHGKHCILNEQAHFQHSLRSRSPTLATTTYLIRGPDFLPSNIGTHPARKEQRAEFAGGIDCRQVLQVPMLGKIPKAKIPRTRSKLAGTAAVWFISSMLKFL